jgi:hypothetical protein
VRVGTSAWVLQCVEKNAHKFPQRERRRVCMQRLAFTRVVDALIALAEFIRGRRDKLAQAPDGAKELPFAL